MPRDVAIPEDLLRAARAIVEKRGAEALTLDALARATRLSRTTVVRRTGGRAALLDALARAGAAVGERTKARERILAAARSVFGRAGFEAASVEEIAQEARVGAATIYRHFGDKDGLVAAFLDTMGPRRGVREAVGATGDLRADLERVASAILRAARDDQAMVRLVLAETLRGSPLLPRVRKLSPVRTLSVIESLLAPHVAPAEDAALLARAFSGLVFSFGVVGPLFDEQPAGDPAATAKHITELFLDGAKGRLRPRVRQRRGHAGERRG